MTAVTRNHKDVKMSLETRHEAGDLLVDYLTQLGVEYVFGVPGGAIEPLYNALARSQRRGGPRAVVARHETGAAFMADGYSRQTGRLGVCCATTGPGTTNLITGVASCQENRVPLLVISAQTALPTLGRGAFQESSCTGINTLGMLAHCTRYNTLVSDASQLETKLVHAITIAMRSRTTVHLTIPRDVLAAPARAPAHDLLKLTQAAPLFDAEAYTKLSNLLAAAHRPVILLGGGAEEATSAILEFALQRRIPVVTTPHGKGLISAYHPLYRGVFGMAGHASTRVLLASESCDLVLAVGTLLVDWDSGNWDEQALLNQRLVVLDESTETFARAPMASLHVQSHLATLFERLVTDGGEQETAVASPQVLLPFPTYPPAALTDDEPARPVDDIGRVAPPRLMRELSQRFPSKSLFLADCGNSLLWAIHYLHPRDRRITGPRARGSSSFRCGIEFASMGWAIGAAVGAALADRRRPVVCITGDGSMLMSGQELTVAAQERLTVIFVVLNDGALGTVKHGQRLAGAEQTGFEIPPVDFAAMARAMGALAHTIRSAADFSRLDIEALCAHPGPSLLDVYIDGEAVPPMGMRIRGLATSKFDSAEVVV